MYVRTTYNVLQSNLLTSILQMREFPQEIFVLIFHQRSTLNRHKSLWRVLVLEYLLRTRIEYLQHVLFTARTNSILFND